MPNRPTLPVYGFIGDDGAARMSHLDRPQPCDKDGMYWQGSFSKVAWTATGFLRRRQRYWLTCERDHRREAPLQAVEDMGRGDLPMHLHRWVCSECGSRKIAISLSD